VGEGEDAEATPRDSTSVHLRPSNNNDRIPGLQRRPPERCHGWCAGLRIEHLHEFPVSDFPQFASMRRVKDRMWRMPPELDKIPMTYSILAAKPRR